MCPTYVSSGTGECCEGSVNPCPFEETLSPSEIFPGSCASLSKGMVVTMQRKQTMRVPSSSHLLPRKFQEKEATRNG